MGIKISVMSMADYDEVIELWKSSEGLGLSDADAAGRLSRYLNRNPGMSYIARDNDRVVGAVISGHDGRRGLIHHLAVEDGYRRQGIGKELVKHCLQAMRSEQIDKCHILVYNDNECALEFWKSLGWYNRPELVLMSHDITVSQSLK